MKIAQHAEPVLMNVPSRLYQKVISIKSIRISAPIVVHAQMFALLRLSIPNNSAILKGIRRAVGFNGSSALLWVIFSFFQDDLNVLVIHKIRKRNAPVIRHI